MPVKGREINLEANSIAHAGDMQDFGRMATSKAIESMLVLFMGDPDASAYGEGYGVKRGAFREADLMVIASSPESMTVKLTPGSALINRQDTTYRTWLLINALESEKQVTIDPTDGSNLRFDVVYITPDKAEESEPVSREYIDENGNISEKSHPFLLTDKFTIGVEKNVSYDTETNPETREFVIIPSGDEICAQNAVELFGEDDIRIPIAVVRVDTNATSITQDKILDLRETFHLRTYPVEHQEFSDYFPLQRPHNVGQSLIVNNSSANSYIPPDTIYIDKSGDDPVVKYLYHDLSAGTKKFYTIPMTLDP